MAELKTKKTAVSPEKFISTLKDKQQQEDSHALIAMMQKLTKAEPRMWGAKIVGFGEVQLKYASGRELDWFIMGFSPLKDSLSIYSSFDISEHQALLDKLGKHKTGKGCLYIKKLEDVDMKVLSEICKKAFASTAKLKAMREEKAKK